MREDCPATEFEGVPVRGCPFCGKAPEAPFFDGVDYGSEAAIVTCERCGLQMTELVDFEGRAQAMLRLILRWNARGEGDRWPYGGRDGDDMRRGRREGGVAPAGSEAGEAEGMSPWYPSGLDYLTSEWRDTRVLARLAGVSRQAMQHRLYHLKRAGVCEARPARGHVLML